MAKPEVSFWDPPKDHSCYGCQKPDHCGLDLGYTLRIDTSVYTEQQSNREKKYIKKEEAGAYINLVISCRQFKQKNTGIPSARHVEANNVTTYYVIGSTIWLNHVIPSQERNKSLRYWPKLSV